MRLVEFEIPGKKILSKLGSVAAKIRSDIGSAETRQGKKQTKAEFSKIFKAFETWLGRSGLTYGGTLTVEKFKLNFGKTPNLDQALEDVGLTDATHKLKKTEVEKILYRVTQLKDQIVSKPVEPSAPDTAEEKAAQEREKLLERLGKVVDKIKTLGDTTGLTVLDPKETKKLETVIKTEVSKSLQKAIEIGIYIIQLGKRYNVAHLISLWGDAVSTGIEWETLKEVQTKVNLSET